MHTCFNHLPTLSSQHFCAGEATAVEGLTSPKLRKLFGKVGNDRLPTLTWLLTLIFLNRITAVGKSTPTLQEITHFVHHVMYLFSCCLLQYTYVCIYILNLYL